MRKFVAFLKHDDAERVTPDDVLAFKGARLADGINPKTVGDSDIAGLRRILGWAVENRRLPSNASEKIRLKRGKATKLRLPNFTKEEAIALIRAASTERNTAESPKLKAAHRWVPWLATYTGARVGELVQLRKQDVREAPEGWVHSHHPRGRHG